VKSPKKSFSAGTGFFISDIANSEREREREGQIEGDRREDKNGEYVDRLGGQDRDE
jgi:hypothetical protein